MPARCFQCKFVVAGHGTGQQHAKLTGHTWQPGYYCPHCQATFTSYSKCKLHMRTCSAHASLPQVSPEQQWCSLPATTAVQDSPEQCDVCQVVFAGKAALLKHQKVVSPCLTCDICVPHATMSLQDHYQASPSMHPKCKRCDLAFDKLSEWAEHRNHCSPPKVYLAPSGDVAAGNGVIALVVRDKSSKNLLPSSTPVPSEPPSALVQEIVSTLSATFSSVGGVSYTIQPEEFWDQGDPSDEADEAENFSPEGIDSVAMMDGLRESLDTAEGRCGIQSTALVPDEPTAPQVIHAATPVDSPHLCMEQSAFDTLLKNNGAQLLAPALEAIDEVGAAGTAHSSGAPGSEDDLGSLGTPPAYVEGSSWCSVSSASVAASVAEACRPTTLIPSVPSRQGSCHSLITSNASMDSIANVELSWHCRSCTGYPCREPVATVCGHIFCRVCFVRELCARGICPICKKVFLVKLKAGVAQ
ncbi:hypothetical protein C8Q78DRAFT_675211 [Trametes maxima]|nr:hypothetical protein C8Q78DRAFT_675211 [Trametes maxima]